MAWLKGCKVVQESYILLITTALGLRLYTSNFKLQIDYCLLQARFFVWCCKVKGKMMSWINFKRILKRNFEIETTGHPNKLEFCPHSCRHFFFTCFLDERYPKLSSFKQENKAIYTVSNEKHDARLSSFFLFLFLFFLIIYFLLVSALCIFVYLCI